MNSHTAPSRAHILEEGVKRLTLLLEAERASFKQHDWEPTPTERKVTSGLDALLNSEEAITPTVVRPYQEVSDGVKVSYEEHGGSNWAVFDFEPSNTREANSTGTVAHSPRIGLHPVFSGRDVSRWMAIETNINRGAIGEFAALRVKLMSEFLFFEPKQAPNINVVRVKLRGDKPDGTFEEFDLGFAPVTSIPTFHTFVFENEKLNKDWLGSFKGVRVLIFLPNFGSYKFNLYAFSLEIE